MSAKNVAWAVKAHGELKITTVDAIQGGEAVIVIVDLVAAGEKASPFVQDYRRLNVAVSRARDGLIIVGDSKSVDQDTLKDATVANSKTKKARKEEWVFAADAPENAGRLWLADYTEEVTTNTVNEDWQNATGDTFAAGDWNENGDSGGSGSGNAGDSAPVQW
ncbi:hypothetical protein BFW01_g12724 [Lasiodiplodia theobromae]|nr:hypothetical protein BFW01_g12724 [Lasiodiplodia theobromae]